MPKLISCFLIIIVSVSFFLAGCNQKSENSQASGTILITYKDSAHYLYFRDWLAKTKDTAKLINFEKEYIQSIKPKISNNQWLKANLQAYDFVFNLAAINPNDAHVFLQNIVEAKADTDLVLKFKANYFLGGDLYDGGEFINCLPYLQEALLISNRSNVASGRDKDYLLNSLGNTFSRFGDYKKASEYLLLAYEFNSSRNEYDLAAKQINNLSRILFDLNLSDSAIGLLKRVDTSQQITAKRRIVTLTELSRQYCKKNFPDSSNYYLQKAKGLLAKLNEREYESSISKIEEASQLLSSKKNDNKLPRLKDINKADKQGDRSFCKQLNLIGYNYLKDGKADTALSFFNYSLYLIANADTLDKFSLPHYEHLYAENTIIESLEAKAEALLLLNKKNPDIIYTKTAVVCYWYCFEVERKLMQYFSYDESKLIMLQESRLRSQKAIALCYQLYQQTHQVLWAEKAFEFAEKNKAFVLLESVKRNIGSNNLLQNDSLYQQTLLQQTKLNYCERQIWETTVDTVKQMLTQQKNKLAADLLIAKTALARQSLAYKVVMEKEDTISPNLVAKKLLNKQTGLLEFFVSDSISYLFVLDSQKPIQFIKYPNTILPLVDNFNAFFSSPISIINNPLVFKKAAFNLYRLLIQNVFDENWKQLIIIPDGKFCLLPFDALLTKNEVNASLKVASYLVKSCNLSSGFSAQILLQQQDVSATDNNTISVFAPVFLNRENKQVALQYSLQEAEAIKGSSVYLKDRATLQNFKKEFNETGIMHIASHAYVDTANNDKNRIAFIDSSLYLNELYALHTNANLVVLSACQTGIGQINTSEGAMSLARGFYYAGAQNVITSLWSVDDRSTATIFGNFYQHLSGNDYAGSLHEAKLNYLKNATAANASPYYWAAFVHIGYQKPAQKKSCVFILIACIVAISAFSFLVYRRRK